MRRANKRLSRGVNSVGQTFPPCSALFSFTQNLKENSSAEMLSFFCYWIFSLDSHVVGYIFEFYAFLLNTSVYSDVSNAE